MQNYLKTTYSLKRAPKSNYPEQLVKYLADRFNLSQGMTLLELGCGRGDFLKQFRKIGMKCCGIDRDIAAKEYSPELDIRIADLAVEKFPFEDNSIDIIYHKSVIEHFYSPDHLMKQSFRVLKPGGKLIILTPDWVSQMEVFYEDITHCRPYDCSALSDVFSMFGFKNIQIEKFNQLPILWKLKMLRIVSGILSLFFNVRIGRKITKFTKIKFFRWSIELMVLGYGEK